MELLVILFSDSCFCGKAKTLFKMKARFCRGSFTWRTQLTDSTQFYRFYTIYRAERDRKSTSKRSTSKLALIPWRCGNRLATDHENFTWLQPQLFSAPDGSTEPSPAIRTGILRLYSMENRMIR